MNSKHSNDIIHLNSHSIHLNSHNTLYIVHCMYSRFQLSLTGETSLQILANNARNLKYM